MLRYRKIMKVKDIFIADDRDLFIKTNEGKLLRMVIIYRGGVNEIIWEKVKIKND